MAKTQAQSEKLGDSVKNETKELTLDAKIEILIKHMEQSKEFYLRSLGALETLQALKKEEEGKKSE